MRKVLYILGELNDEDVEWITAAGHRASAVDAALTLIREGEPVADLFIILDGHGVVSVEGVGTVARLGSGEIVGEMSFVDSAPPSATVVADPRCTVLALPKRAIEARLRQDLGFAARFYRAMALFLADRLRSANTRGKTGGSLADGRVVEDELDEGLLDNLSLAGVRFERMLAKLSGSAQPG